MTIARLASESGGDYNICWTLNMAHRCENSGYLGRAEDVRMIAGAASAIASCNLLRIPVVIVTNQSGIARGLYDWNGFTAVQGAIKAALARCGAHVDAVMACAYHAQGRGPLRVAGHPWRKPAPGMILEAASRMALDLPRSWIVGDRADDLQAGRAAGLGGAVHVLTGQGERERAEIAAAMDGEFPVVFSCSLAQGVARLHERRLLHPAAPEG
ncbi:MAG: HAD-IIIA family hydrolase [Proteobacteria bacterium]|nr:HAD-IIIA family hydrolase [Pseudomonadota bacterium]